MARLQNYANHARRPPMLFLAGCYLSTAATVGIAYLLVVDFSAGRVSTYRSLVPPGVEQASQPTGAWDIGRIRRARDVLRPEAREALGGPRVFGYELVTKGKDIHRWHYWSVTQAALALSSISAHRCMTVSNGSSSSSNIPVGNMVA